MNICALPAFPRPGILAGAACPFPWRFLGHSGPQQGLIHSLVRPEGRGRACSKSCLTGPGASPGQGSGPRLSFDLSSAWAIPFPFIKASGFKLLPSPFGNILLCFVPVKGMGPHSSAGQDPVPDPRAVWGGGGFEIPHSHGQGPPSTPGCPSPALGTPSRGAAAVHPGNLPRPHLQLSQPWDGGKPARIVEWGGSRV